MTTRITYGAAAIMVLLGLFLLDVSIAKEAVLPPDSPFAAAATWRDGPVGLLLRHGSVIPLLVLTLSLAGVAELDTLVRARGANPCTRFAYAMVAASILVPWLCPAGLLGEGVAQIEGLMWSLVCVMVSVIGAGVLVVLRRDPVGAVANVGATLLMILYLGFMLSFAVQLRCGFELPGVEGAWLLLIAAIVTKASDIGAYFAGSAFGRHKLLPRISPAKSVEGVVGGLAGSSVVAVAIVLVYRFASSRIPVGQQAYQFLGLVLDATRTFSEPAGKGSLPPLPRAALFGLIMSACGQIGDLLESSFKRDADTKDSGRILPRFGGILDLVDSPVVSIPVAWLLLTVVWRIV